MSHFPLLKRSNIDVVAHGPSLHDQNSYYLIRRFDSLAHREQSEDVFYGSDEWRQGPREAILALIENYTDIILELDDVTVQGCAGNSGSKLVIQRSKIDAYDTIEKIQCKNGMYLYTVKNTSEFARGCLELQGLFEAGERP